MNIDSSTGTNYITDASGATTVNVSGASAATVVLNAAVTTANASTSTGGVTIDASALTISSTGPTITGGTGSDTVVMDDATSASSAFSKVTGFETIKLATVGTNIFDAAIAGVTTFDLTNAADTTLTLATGYTGATTVKLTGDSGDTVNNTAANIALTVNANIADVHTGTNINGGTGTDVLNLTADGTTLKTLTNVAGVETINILANTTTASTTAEINMVDGNVASTKTLTVDASALTNSSATFKFVGSDTDGSYNVTGGAGKDTITGGDVADTINGGAGNDSIVAGSGNDSVDAGTGDDTINMAGNLTSADTINGGDGTDTISVTSVASGAFTNVTNVEKINIAGATTLSLSSPVSTSDVTFTYTAGTAQVVTLATGYTGNTTVIMTGATTDADKVVNDANVAMTVNLGEGDLANVSIDGGTGTDVINITAEAGNATFTAGVVDVDTINILANTTDATTAVSLTTDNANVAANKTLTINAAALTNSAATFTFNGFAENNGNFNVTGGAAADTITGGSGNDIVDGAAGNDSIVAGAGNDSLNGGAGNDSIDMAGNLTFDDTVAGGDGTDTLLIAAAGASTFGNAGELSHVSGVESLKFMTNNFNVNAGSSFTGFNKFDLTDAADTTLTLAAGFTGATTVVLTGDATANADSVTNTANVALTIAANASDIDATTTISGGTGTDVINLKADNGMTNMTAVTGVETITLVAGSTASADATIVIAANTVASTATAKTMTVDAAALIDSGAVLTFDGSLGDAYDKLSITGGAGNDVIKTGAAADTINGGAGSDFINSGAGVDMITTGSGADVVAMGTNSNALVMATISDMAAGDALALDTVNLNSTATFTSTAVTLAEGASLSDYINAAASSTTANTNTVVSWFQFGGNTYVVQDNATGSTFTANDDSVIKMTGLVDFSAATLNTTANTLTLATTATSTAVSTVALVATANADTIVGTANADVIDGLVGNDTISGGAGNDSITGGTGADSITAGAGDDTIVLGSDTAIDTVVFASTAATNGTDTITGFEEGASKDILDFTAFLGAASHTTVVTDSDGTAPASGSPVTIASKQVVVLVDIAGNQDILTASGLTTALAASGEYEYYNMGNSDKAIAVTYASGAGTVGKMFYLESSAAGAITATLVGTVTVGTAVSGLHTDNFA